MSQTHSTESLNALTETIIGRAIEIHRSVGPGLLEAPYVACLAYELHTAGVRYELQKPIPLLYHGVAVDCAYRADLVVEDEIIVEVKALQTVAPIHKQQLYTYLRLSNRPLGLLLNFGAATMKAGITRVVNGLHE